LQLLHAVKLCHSVIVNCQGVRGAHRSQRVSLSVYAAHHACSFVIHRVSRTHTFAPGHSAPPHVSTFLASGTRLPALSWTSEESLAFTITVAVLLSACSPHIQQQQHGGAGAGCGSAGLGERCLRLSACRCGQQLPIPSNLHSSRQAALQEAASSMHFCCCCCSPSPRRCSCPSQPSSC
jgi:hypothetical protein